MIVHLVATGGGRYDIESVPVEAGAGRPAGGFWSRQVSRARDRWARVVHDAQHDPRRSAWARWRTRVICHLHDSAEEQRSLWVLRDRASATLVHPPDLSREQASAVLRQLLGRARRHHLRWLAVDTVLFLVSGLLMLVPGPNLVAYYFAVRVIGHYLSWRGARQALDAVAWTFEPGS